MGGLVFFLNFLSRSKRRKGIILYARDGSFHGISMDIPWNFLGLSMEFPRPILGKSDFGLFPLLSENKKHLPHCLHRHIEVCNTPDHGGVDLHVEIIPLRVHVFRLFRTRSNKL